MSITIPTPRNKVFIAIALAGIIIQFTLFKWCYPYADFFVDSYVYINAAAHHAAISLRPIGYSRFLQLIHCISTSDTVLVGIQYLFLQAAGLFFFFSLRRFFTVGKTASLIIFIFLVCNPASLYISNYISSDAVFMSISLVWITHLLYIIHRPVWHQVIIQAVLVYCCFTLRYAALYYPAITAIAFLMSRHTAVVKITGIILSIVPVLVNIQQTRQTTYQQTGTAVFSAFSGWQVANNALHLFPHITVTENELPAAAIPLQKLVKKYFDTVHSPFHQQAATTLYMWDARSPLFQYMLYIKVQRKIPNDFIAWTAVAPVLSAYGNHLIKKHPLAFARYYLWPSAKIYLLPPVESLDIYNEGKDSVEVIAKNWFGYKSTQVHSLSKNVQRYLLQPFSVLFLAVNIIFFLALTGVLIKHKKISPGSEFFRLLLFAGICWALHTGFMVFSTPVVFRYQLFPLIVYLALSVVLLQYVLFTTRLRPYKPGSTG